MPVGPGEQSLGQTHHPIYSAHLQILEHVSLPRNRHKQVNDQGSWANDTPDNSCLDR